MKVSVGHSGNKDHEIKVMCDGAQAMLERYDEPALIAACMREEKHKKPDGIFHSFRASKFVDRRFL